MTTMIESIGKKELKEVLSRMENVVNAIGMRKDVSVKAHTQLLKITDILFELKFAEITD